MAISTPHAWGLKPVFHRADSHYSEIHPTRVGSEIFGLDAKHPPFQVASFDVALAMLTYIEALYNASPMHSESQREAQMQFIVQSAHATLEFTKLLEQSSDARLANIDQRRRMIEIGGEFISNPARG